MWALTKAHDCANINIRLMELELYGFGGKILQLFSSYLIGKEQYISMNGGESKMLSVSGGVGTNSI